MDIASRFNIRHPRQGSFPSPISTDFVITCRDGIHARTVKETKDLNDPRVLEKFSIEYEYWRQRGIDWKVVTEKQINRVRARNLQWLHAGPSLEDLIPDEKLRNEAASLLLDLIHEGDFAFSSMIEIVEDALELRHGSGITLYKSLVMSGCISLNLDYPINFMDPFAKED